METKEAFRRLDKIEAYLARYRLLIGVLVLIMLIVLSLLTVKFFDKQNEIIETGGFIDGKIKCVCNQEAWDRFQMPELNLSNMNFSDG